MGGGAPWGTIPELAQHAHARPTGVEGVATHVQDEAVPLDGPGPPARLVGLQDQYPAAGPRRGGSGGQTGQTAADHDHVPVDAHDHPTSESVLMTI